jgi:hypothetical protein
MSTNSEQSPSNSIIWRNTARYAKGFHTADDTGNDPLFTLFAGDLVVTEVSKGTPQVKRT